ncbi:amidase domain-containing protein [Gottfriedia acidiceleris]|uniref:amidase domain-containing protein n=1 Tax=Gottfriedia acidiceleris TaxID=371036 RepID=UPI000B448860|nr:amidase domain-containing protein [Gottfriedia acidiceleris]
MFCTEITLGDIEKILFNYLIENDLNYEIGSKDLSNYLFNQLMFESDQNLRNHTEYKEILAYAAMYINEFSKHEYLEIHPVFDMGRLSNLSISEIIENNKNKEEVAKNNIKESLKAAASWNISKAVSYARSWGKGRNSEYGNYTYDCTNFVSQILFAGGISKTRPSNPPSGTYGTTKYWYSDQVSNPGGYPIKTIRNSTSWVRVIDFYDYWGPKVTDKTLYTLKDTITYAAVGDVIQYKYANTGERWHSVFVTSKTSSTVKVTQHTRDDIDFDIREAGTSNRSWSVLKFSNY